MTWAPDTFEQTKRTKKQAKHWERYSRALRLSNNLLAKLTRLLGEDKSYKIYSLLSPVLDWWVYTRNGQRPFKMPKEIPFIVTEKSGLSIDEVQLGSKLDLSNSPFKMPYPYKGNND